MLSSFDFCASTRCIFGDDSEEKVGEVLKADGAKKVLVVHDDGPFLYESGLLAKIFKSLTDAGLGYIDFGGVRPCPLRSRCKEGIATYRTEGCNYLLAVGGGSSIDSAKAISAGVTYDGNFDDMFEREIPIDLAKKPNVAVIVTIASTGSETGFAAVIYEDDQSGYQFGGAIKGTGNILRPNITFLDPKLTLTVPPFQTACGIVDMFGHVCERYITVQPYGIVDYMEEAVMKSIIEFGQRVIRDPSDLEARGELLWAANVAHNDTVGVGRRKDFGAHSCGSAFGPMFGTVHGATISIVMASWMRQLYKKNIDRFYRYAVNVWNVTPDPTNPDRVCREGIDRTEQFFKCLGAPTNFAEGRIPVDRLDEIIDVTMLAEGGACGRVFKLGREDVSQILKAAAGVQ